MDTLEIKLREALTLVDYLEIESQEHQVELQGLACELSRRIKSYLGEVPVWFLANRIIWAIDKAKILKGG